MIYSMTGFASVAAELETSSLSLELRSVNSRYLDLQLRMPDELRTQEPALREAIAAQMSRGKVECRINLATRQSVQEPARLNPDMVKQLALWSAQVRKYLSEARELSVADVLRWNGVLESPALSAETLQTTLHSLLQQALKDFAAASASVKAKNSRPFCLNA